MVNEYLDMHCSGLHPTANNSILIVFADVADGLGVSSNILVGVDWAVVD